jgi:DNA-binding transcriptional ArsR family regulator
VKEALNRRSAEAYFLSVLGLKLKVVPYEDGKLPFYLSNLFSLGVTEIEGRRLLYCRLSGDARPSPAQIKKYAAELRARTALEPVLVLPGLSAWDRSRLIEGRVAFVVPGRQLYLPTLLLDLREHFERERGRPDRLSFPAQFLVLLQLLHGTVEGKTVRELSRELSYSAATMSRAARELEALGLVETDQGKARPLHFGSNRRGLWQAALPHLQTPRKGLWFLSANEILPQLPEAGISALSRFSSLNDDSQRTYALSATDAKPLIEDGRARKQCLDESDSQLEVWAYDPKALAGVESKTVDPLSLQLSLASENDERVKKELEALIGRLF